MRSGVTEKASELVIGLLVFLSLVVLLVGSTHCRWREGRSVWIQIYDAGGDSDADAIDDGLDSGCIENQGQWISPEDLLGFLETESEDLIIIDVRPMELCATARIPGAECNPMESGALTAEIVASDEEGWLIVYDGAGELGDETLDALPSLCHRRIVFLAGGFGAWAARSDFPLDEGEP